MSGASQAVDALQAAARAAYTATVTAGRFFAQRHSDVRVATDLTDVMARTIDLVAAVEALHDAADAAVRDLRAALAATMNDTGCTQVQGSHHAAHLARKPAFLNISDEAAIPRSFYVQPPPQLDRSALKAALKDGAQVPGVSMLQPNEMSLVLRAKKETV
jgi:hypothetical protein